MITILLQALVFPNFFMVFTHSFFQKNALDGIIEILLTNTINADQLF